MDEQELIQVNMQLPSRALDSLSRLAEQLQKLTAAIYGLSQPAGTPEEIMESGSFDPERFLALRQKEEIPAAETQQSEPPEARPATTKVLSQVQEPESAGQKVSKEEPVREEAVPREDETAPEPDIQTAESAIREDSEEIPAAHPEIETPVPDAPVVHLEPEGWIPEAEEIWMQAEEREFPLPASQTEPLAGAETPQGAGIVVTAQPETPVSRWAGVTEELVTAGPAPLTAEAVSLAFQRDGRRYDNGFPLY